MSKAVMAIELGTTKVSVLACRISRNGSLELSGLGQAGYSGIQDDGWMSDKTIYHVLDAAVGQARKMAGLKIDQCVLGIPNEFCGVVSNTKEINLGRTVSKKDVMELRKLVSSYPLPSPWKINNVSYGSFLVDGKPVGNPLGLPCEQLGLQASVICIRADFARNITRILNTLNLEVYRWIPTSYACGEALITQEEREKGVIWIDVGGESTDLAVYKNGIPVLYDWISLGGAAITRDVATGTGASAQESEKLKKYCVLGLAYKTDSDASEMNMSIRSGKNIQNIPMEFLQEIVEARIEELLEMVRDRITAEDLWKECHGVVLAGGGLALYRGIREFASHTLGLPVRLGVPDTIGLSCPSLSAVYSLGWSGLKYFPDGRGSIKSVLINWLKKFRY
ncbi:MAG TPA: cell division protein FtsA [Clostridiales bacterium]|nr:cell division protein FtsA [Clostridiales bacterium]